MRRARVAQPLLAVLAAAAAAWPAAAAGATVDAGPLRGEVDDRTGEVRLTDAAGAAVLAEAAGVRAGFRTAAGWHRATRAVRVARDGDAVLATLATTDPAGRTLALRMARDATGVVAVSLGAEGPGVLQAGIGFAARPAERYLGFGERSNAVDQRGNEVESFVGEGPYQPEERAAMAAFVPPQGYRPRDDATYYPVPWLLSTAGYGVLVDDDEVSTFDLARTRGDAWSVAVEAPRLTLRVFAGPRPADVLRRFTARTGRQPPVAAPWMLGAWWQPTPGSDPVAQLAAQRAADVPVSVTETFLHYLPCADHLADRAGVRRRVADLKGLGTAVLAYVNPMVCTSHPRYAEGTYNTDPSGQPYRYRYSTADQFLVSQVDFTAPAGRAFFGSLLREALDDGFDGWMEDFGEYTPQDAGSADGTPGTRMHNRYPTLYHRAATELTADAGRPIANYVRSGWTGTAPYARIVWGGDPTTDWGFDGLHSAIRNGLTMGLSGVSTWGSDIGGFFSLGSRRLTPELFQRWIQFGAVSGVMRAKSKGIAVPEKPRPQVEDPEILPVWKRYAKLRTQLLPYLQAADAEYQRTGMPMMRSFALLWPGDARLGAVDDSFLFGPDLLAAPVVRPGETRRRVVLPPGEWIDLWRSARQRAADGGLEVTGVRLIPGGRATTIQAPVEDLPLLVRAGAILPLLPADVDTLRPGRVPGLVELADRFSRLRLAIWPRGWSAARPYGTERVVSSERARGARRWVLRVRGTRRRAFEVEAAMRTLRRPFRPCAVVTGPRGRPVPFTYREGVLRFAVRGRDVRVEARAC